MSKKEKLISDFKKDIYGYLDFLIDNHDNNSVTRFNIDVEFYFKYLNTEISKEKTKKNSIYCYVVQLKGINFEFNRFKDNDYFLYIRKTKFFNNNIIDKDIFISLKLEIDSNNEKKHINNILNEVECTDKKRKRL